LRTLYGYDDCDRTAKILGVAYFIHSAYFLTTFVLVLHDLIRIAMMCFYLSLLIVIMLETRKSLRCIDTVREFAGNMLPMGQLEESLALKRRLIKRQLLATACYCIGVFICLFFLQHHPVNWTFSYGLVLEGWQHEDRKSFMSRYLLIKELGEILIFTSIFILWRPRRWPQFFALDVPYDAFSEGNSDDSLPDINSILQAATIRNSIAGKRCNADDWSQNTSFYSASEPFVIVDPLGLNDPAAIKEYELSEMENIREKTRIISQINIGYKKLQ